MVNIISLVTRVSLTIFAIIILGLIARIDTQISQARVKYIVAVGTIGTALEGFYGIPMEFVSFRANRWILATIDCVAWMLLFAAAVIAADDIHTCNAVARLGAVSFETCHLVKAACAFAFTGFAFSLFLFAYELYLIKTGDDSFGGSKFRSTNFPPQTTATTGISDVTAPKEETPAA